MYYTFDCEVLRLPQPHLSSNIFNMKILIYNSGLTLHVGFGLAEKLLAVYIIHMALLAKLLINISMWNLCAQFGFEYFIVRALINERF